MNIVKFRPVGKSGPIQKVKVSQSKRSIYSRKRENHAFSLSEAHKFMDRRGFVRVN